MNQIAELPTPRLNFARMSAKDGENMKLKCEISGSPYSDVLITFTPCYQKDRCLDKKHNYGTKVLVSISRSLKKLSGFNDFQSFVLDIGNADGKQPNDHSQL